MSFCKRVAVTAYDVFPVLNRPMAVCAVICVCAIALLYAFQSSALSLLVLLAIVLLIFCIVTKNKKIIFISILTFAVCASAVNEFMTVEDLNAFDGQTMNIELTATEDSYDTGKVHKVTAFCSNSDSIPKYTKFSLYYFFEREIYCGETFSGTVKLSSLENSDYKLYNYGNSVYMDCRLVKITDYSAKNPFFEKVGNIRRYMVDTLCDKFPDDISSILIALNCGDRKYLSDEFYAKVIICGLAHVMVVSGLHISIIIGMIFRIFEKFYYNRYVKFLVALTAILLIVAVCGFTLSVLRAGIMFIFFVLSPIFLRKNDSLNSLGSAVVLILFFGPFSIFSVSFQLSVTATLAVVWIAPFYSNLILKKLYIHNSFGKNLVSVLTVSICAMIFTAPITISVFGTFALLAPVAFLLITFPVTYALGCNTLALIFSAVKGLSFLSEPLFIISGLCTRYIKFIIEKLGLLDFMLIRADIVAIMVFMFLIFALIVGMYLYKYYIKCLKRNFVSEVRTNGYTKRNNA